MSIFAVNSQTHKQPITAYIMSTGHIFPRIRRNELCVLIMTVAVIVAVEMAIKKNGTTTMKTVATMEIMGSLSGISMLQ